MKIARENFLIDKFYKSKLIFNIYDYLTQVYSSFMYFLENIIFRKESYCKKFEKLGIIKFKSRFNINELNHIYSNIILGNSSSIKIIGKKNLDFFLNEIFNKDLREKITETTGFNFSIDYFKVYENKKLLNDNRKYHFDKSFSRNMLKVFIPLNICKNSGPLKVFDKLNSKKIRKRNTLSNLKYNLITGEGEFIYCINPNTCFHKEGNPDDGFSSQQIMFQLNAASKWSYRADLYERQLSRENKFTSFSSIISKKNFFKK